MKRIMFFIILSLLACSGNNTSSLDGTWRVTQLECNGVPGDTSATGAASIISNGNTNDIIISGNKAVVHRIISGCRIYISMDISYSAGNIIDLNFPYAVTCSPAACHAMCGATPGIVITYTYKLIGLDKLSIITSDPEEGLCTGATPVQQHPTKQVMERI